MQGKEGALLQKRIRQLQQDSKKGISMAIVLCTAAFFVAFAAAIVYTAGLLTAQANGRLEQERCYQLAKSYAKVLDGELTRYQTKEEAEENTFYSFANKFLDGTYANYDPGDPQTVFYYQPVTTSETEKNYGDITIALHKEADDAGGENVMQGTLQAGEGNYSQQIEKLEENSIIQYILTVEVIAKYNDSSYTYSTEYYRMENYQAAFSHNGTSLVWGKDNEWHVGNDAGAVYNGEITEDNPVSYTLDKKQVLKERYEPVHKEADSK